MKLAHNNSEPTPGLSEKEMGLSNENGRFFRNPSGRTARIAPDIGSGSSSNRAGQPKPKPVASRTATADPPAPDQDFSWAHVTGSFRREQAVSGLMWGAAVGDALGLGRGKLGRTSTLKIFGRGPLKFVVVPGLGIPGSDFHRMIMTMQAALRSRSQLEIFRRSFAYRLRGYFLTLPFFAGRPTFLASLRLCLGANSDLSGIESAENDTLTSALAIATILQGTGHSAERWTALNTEATHTRPEAVESSVLVARTAYLAVMTDPTDFDSVSLMDRLITVTEDPGLGEQLKQLREGLLLGLGTHEMACEMGWGHGIPSSAGPTALMAIYSWLTNHLSFEKTVERAILLGGDAETLGAVAGGLSGIHLGKKGIPERWRDALFAFPNTRRWMNATAKRFVDWPHGSEDLHQSPAMPSRPVLQFCRSLVLNLILGLLALVRLPWRLFHRWFDR